MMVLLLRLHTHTHTHTHPDTHRHADEDKIRADFERIAARHAPLHAPRARLIAHRDDALRMSRANRTTTAARIKQRHLAKIIHATQMSAVPLQAHRTGQQNNSGGMHNTTTNNENNTRNFLGSILQARHFLQGSVPSAAPPWAAGVGGHPRQYLLLAPTSCTASPPRVYLHPAKSVQEQGTKVAATSII